MDTNFYLRNNRELRIATAWVTAAVAGTAYQFLHHLSPWWLSGALCLAMAIRRTPMAATLICRQSRTQGGELKKVSIDWLKKWMAGHPNDIYLGEGFEWDNTMARRAYEMLRKDTLPPATGDAGGVPWIHGLGQSTDAVLPLKFADGHVFIVGTTGVGKTRAFDLMITQAILREEAVIVIDPKGDQDLYNKMRAIYARLGQAEKFAYFHAAHPERSMRLDPLKNWNRPTELASRVAALVPSETGADPFTAFDWKVLNDIVYGLILIETRPTLKRLRAHIENSPERLLGAALKRYFAQHVDHWEERLRPYLRNGPKSVDETAACVKFYRAEVSATQSSSEMDGLISQVEHNRDHFAKMTASLIPILSMLTTGALGDLLSPDPSADDPRPITDMRRIIDNGQGAYFGLDSLSDNKVASAIGAILLADVTAVAGDRYNYANLKTIKPVNLFADEINEILNAPFVQLINKGRGAMMRVAAATQSIADLEVRTGNKAKAQQFLGNFNTVISLRVFAETQKFVVDQIPKTTVEQVSRSHSAGTGMTAPAAHSSGMSESRSEREVDRFPAPLLGALPKFEYIARMASGRIIKGKIPIVEV
ncbi:MAG: conjugative transfer system coupling protein TraD [Acidiferrobacterales bacterium]